MKNLQVAIDVCERTSENILEEEGSVVSAIGKSSRASTIDRERNRLDQVLWNCMLNQLLDTKSRLKTRSEAKCHRIILEKALTDLMAHAYSKMCLYISAGYIVRRITDNYSFAQWGEIRDIMQQVLDTAGYEDMIHHSAITLVNNDLHKLMATRRNAVGSGKFISRRIHTVHSRSYPTIDKARRASNNTRRRNYKGMGHVSIDDIKKGTAEKQWSEMRPLRVKPELDPLPHRITGQLPDRARYSGTFENF